MHEHPEDQNMAHLSDETTDPLDEALLMPEIPEARAYLVEGTEYRWLLSRMQAAARMMPTTSTDSEIRGDIASLIGNAHRIELKMDWCFPTFLLEQYDRPDEVELRDVLCCSGLADKAFVATCADYADLLWPRFGQETVGCLSLGLRKDSKKMLGMGPVIYSLRHGRQTDGSLTYVKF